MFNVKEDSAFAAAACPLAVARAAQDGGGFDRTLWNRVAAQGWLGAAIPEEYGGLGLSHVELAAVTEELGATLAPLPWGPTLLPGKGRRGRSADTGRRRGAGRGVRRLLAREQGGHPPPRRDRLHLGA